MSWDKNTVNLSDVDSRIHVLNQIGISYSLITLGEVGGHGLNDFDGKTYPIRQLKYKDIVVLEQMIREDDCDFDDMIISYEFFAQEEPKNWPLERREQ